jgi:hypothetical protein
VIKFTSCLPIVGPGPTSTRQILTNIERDNIVVFNYISVSGFWPDKRDGLWWSGLIRGMAFGGVASGGSMS